MGEGGDLANGEVNVCFVFVCLFVFLCVWVCGCVGVVFCQLMYCSRTFSKSPAQ